MNTIDKDYSELFLSFFEEDDIVLVAPLNWGLGHASRCIPLIGLLREHCAKVIIATDGAAMELLSQEFADIDKCTLPGYNIRYRHESIVLNILLSLPKIVKAVLTENKYAQKAVKTTGATVILSDNRLGFMAKGIRNYYLTHQINILHKNRLIAAAGSYLHQWFIKKFHLCLIPDHEGTNSLCPALSYNKDIQARFIGPTTRIKKVEIPIEYDICVLLSGPEPQRSILETLLLKELKKLNQYKILFIRGIRGHIDLPPAESNITAKNIITSSSVEQALNSSRLLICRSGYSTIMDIYGLDINAILIPTPGQTEQEYLANFFADSGKYCVLNQNEINKLSETIKYLI